TALAGGRRACIACRWTRAHGGGAGAWRDAANLRCRGANGQRAGTYPSPTRQTSNAPRPIPVRLEVGRATRGQRPTPTRQHRRDGKLTARRVVCGGGDGAGRRLRGGVPRTGIPRSHAPAASARHPPRPVRPQPLATHPPLTPPIGAIASPAGRGATRPELGRRPRGPS